ncbi:hypothetical protein Bbelb_111960 [Branchiostoma belcheri]|nr:hypothetical protein Bbelb_111960 [Branchiostoma belcheri]
MPLFRENVKQNHVEEYNTGYSVSPGVPARPRVGSPDGRRPEGDPTRGRAGTEGDAEYTVPARPRVGSPDGRRPEGDPTRGRAGIEGDAEYTRRTRRTRNAFDLFYGSPGRTVKYGPVRNTVIECYRGPVFGGAALVGWSPGRRYNFEASLAALHLSDGRRAADTTSRLFRNSLTRTEFRHRFSRQWQYFPLSRRRCRDASIHTAKKSDRTEHRVWLVT